MNLITALDLANILDNGSLTLANESVCLVRRLVPNRTVDTFSVVPALDKYKEFSFCSLVIIVFLSMHFFFFEDCME